METSDREILARAGERWSPKAAWLDVLAARPAYFTRWLAAVAVTHPDSARALLTAAGLVKGGATAPPLSDPDGARAAAARHRFTRAAELFAQPAPTREELQRFDRRFAELSEPLEGLLWLRTSDATYLALLELIGLTTRAAPASEIAPPPDERG